jgi:hypothetical protein
VIVTPSSAPVWKRTEMFCINLRILIQVNTLFCSAKNRHYPKQAYRSLPWCSLSWTTTLCDCIQDQEVRKRHLDVPWMQNYGCPVLS